MQGQFEESSKVRPGAEGLSPSPSSVDVAAGSRNGVRLPAYGEVLEAYKRTQYEGVVLPLSKFVRLRKAEKSLVDSLVSAAAAVKVSSDDGSDFEEWERELNETLSERHRRNGNGKGKVGRNGGSGRARSSQKRGGRNSKSRLKQDFSKFELSSLRRYKKAYGVAGRLNCTKAELAELVEDHFYTKWHRIAADALPGLFAEVATKLSDPLHNGSG